MGEFDTSLDVYDALRRKMSKRKRSKKWPLCTDMTVGGVSMHLVFTTAEAGGCDCPWCTRTWGVLFGEECVPVAQASIEAKLGMEVKMQIERQVHLYCAINMTVMLHSMLVVCLDLCHMRTPGGEARDDATGFNVMYFARKRAIAKQMGVRSNLSTEKLVDLYFSCSIG